MTADTGGGGPDAVLTGLNRRGVPAVVTLVGTPDWANDGLDAEQAAAGQHGVRRLRVRRGEPVPVRPSLDDLERAEPGTLAEPASPKIYVDRLLNPGYARDQGGEPVRAASAAA